MVAKLYQKFQQQPLTFKSSFLRTSLSLIQMEVPGSLFFSLLFISVCKEMFPFKELFWCFFLKYIFSAQNYLILLPPIAPYMKTSIKHAASARFKKSNPKHLDQRTPGMVFFVVFLKNKIFKIAFPNRLASEYFAFMF